MFDRSPPHPPRPDARATAVLDAAAIAARAQVAAERIYRLARRTPVAPLPGDEAGALVKMEQLQVTGAFKLRGATNKLMSLSEAAMRAGVITSSTGNHGLGVATAAQALRIGAEVYLSAQVSEAKRAKIVALGAQIRIAGDDPLAAELAARAAAAATGRTYVSPYNDAEVIAGQGTLGVEILEQAPDVAAVYVAVGGGGLISGIGSVLKRHAPQIEVVGCWPEHSAALYESLRAGRIVEAPELPTLSESTAGGVEPDSITFALAREVIDHTVLVSEAQILAAMRFGVAQGWAMEGASGVALAAYWRDRARLAGRRALVLLCGGNPSPQVAAQI